MKVCSRVLPGPSSVDIILIAPAEHHASFLAPLSFADGIDDTHYRHKREAYDPYDAYYFYPKSLNQQQQQHRAAYSYDRQEIDNGYINRRDTDESNRVESQRGQKYKYTPLFQYKSTQSRRRKLFVPNLFG